MWQIATRQRTALLITGRPDQHLGVDVGLVRAEHQARETPSQSNGAPHQGPAADQEPAAA
jgi:NADH dehydrogenase